jgi:hypothetical protein
MKNKENFFFEKKKPRHPHDAGQVPYNTTAGRKSLLVLFFRKEHACLFPDRKLTVKTDND